MKFQRIMCALVVIPILSGCSSPGRRSSRGGETSNLPAVAYENSKPSGCGLSGADRTRAEATVLGIILGGAIGAASGDMGLSLLIGVAPIIAGEFLAKEQEYQSCQKARIIKELADAENLNRGLYFYQNELKTYINNLEREILSLRSGNADLSEKLNHKSMLIQKAKNEVSGEIDYVDAEIDRLNSAGGDYSTTRRSMNSIKEELRTYKGSLQKLSNSISTSINNQRNGQFQITSFEDLPEIESQSARRSSSYRRQPTSDGRHYQPYNRHRHRESTNLNLHFRSRY